MIKHHPQSKKFTLNPAGNILTNSQPENVLGNAEQQSHSPIYINLAVKLVAGSRYSGKLHQGAKDCSKQCTIHHPERFRWMKYT